MTDRRRAWLATAVALFVLNASLTFRNLWPTPLVTWHGELSMEFGLWLIALRWLAPAVVSRRRVLAATTTIWMLLGVGRYIDVTAPALWGRELNFYWDLRFLPDVAAMLATVAHRWLVLAAVVVVVLAIVAIWRGLRWAIRRVALSAEPLAARRRFAAAGAVIVAVFLLQQPALDLPRVVPYAAPVTAMYARQAAAVTRGMSRSLVLPPSPNLAGDFSAVSGADVLLFFVESYGAITFDNPSFRSTLTAGRATFSEAIADSGFHVVSGFVESPTFGGSSWFAHVSLLSGIEVRDPDTNALLLRAKRPTLPSALADKGYRTIAVMPGMWSDWREGSFYGFRDTYTAPRLGYAGPPFGWWDLTDQFAFAALDRLERTSGHAPLFVFLPTVSTHTPFTPTPPYQPDWRRMTTDAPYSEAELQQAYGEGLDWTNLAPAYLKAVTYSYQTLAGYLREHAGEDIVLIVLGDHQPPALVSGEGASWDVPVHVIAKRTAILDRLREHGFRDGVVPERPVIGKMHELTPLLVKAFSQ